MHSQWRQVCTQDLTDNMHIGYGNGASSCHQDGSPTVHGSENHHYRQNHPGNYARLNVCTPSKIVAWMSFRFVYVEPRLHLHFWEIISRFMIFPWSSTKDRSISIVCDYSYMYVCVRVLFIRQVPQTREVKVNWVRPGVVIHELEQVPFISASWS